MLDIIQGLWIGPKLSTMERLSIKSFLDNGHEYHLYTYSDIEGVPEGASIKDGNEIIPESEIFTYSSGEGKGSVSAFSNFFRYKLLYDKGGWWVDTDMICLKPFDFDDEYVFSSEHYVTRNEDVVTSGVIKAPKESEVAKNNWEICKSKDPIKIVWGEVGPRLVREAVKEFELDKYVKPHQTFCPLGFEEWFKVLNPNIQLKFGEDVYALHLWNEMWRRSKMDKDKSYNSKCLYEKLKKQHLGNKYFISNLVKVIVETIIKK